ncbi:hypothetical protein B0H14DRAFT_2568280 [Mycena olivaceomarginata]|nr:hypothetical protein B0H14DRAFT_2568280 [Mycena olivaceomarginata]
MSVEAAYSHNLRHHQRILIRSRGVTGSDEDVHIATLVAEVQLYQNELCFVAHTPPPPRPLRLLASPSQHQLASSASSVSLGMVGKGKKRKIEEESSDDEIIVTGYKAPIPSRRPRLTVHIPSSSASLPALSPSSPGPSTLSTAGPSTPTFPPLDSSPTFPASISLLLLDLKSSEAGYMRTESDRRKNWQIPLASTSPCLLIVGRQAGNEPTQAYAQEGWNPTR